MKQKILIISSTNRNEPQSFRLAELYQKILKNKGVDSEILDLRDFPAEIVSGTMYDQPHPGFEPFQKKMEVADRFIFIIPEYNASFPGILKLFIDLLKFPATLRNKKCALVGISSGMQGGSLAMSHLSDVLNYCGVNVLAKKVRLPVIEKHLDDEGKISDAYLKRLSGQAGMFIEF